MANFSRIRAKDPFLCEREGPCLLYTSKQPVLEAMARALDVNPEWLMGRSDRREPENEIGFDDFTYALHREAQALTEENRNKLLEMARIFRAAQQADRNK